MDNLSTATLRLTPELDNRTRQERRSIIYHLVDKLKRPVEPEDHQVSWSLYFADPDGNPWEITTYQHAVVATLLTPIGT